MGASESGAHLVMLAFCSLLPPDMSSMVASTSHLVSSEANHCSSSGTVVLLGCRQR